MKRPIEYGFPFTVSRNTDFPRFWMREWFKWMDRGYINASDPSTGLPEQWSLAPPDVHSVIWWSKDYRRWVTHSRRTDLDVYRQFFNMTICGDPTTELRVPPLEDQLESFKEIVDLYGIEKVQWRFSPVPMDWKENFIRISQFMEDLGLRSCYFSFLHSGSRIPETRSIETRKDIVHEMCNILDKHSMTLLGCWDDSIWVNEKIQNYGLATCVDANLIDKIYGANSRLYQTEHGCSCSKSIEVGNQILFPCPHNCTYCYAREEK